VICAAIDAPFPCCVSCRGHHRVRGNAGTRVGYCEACLALSQLSSNDEPGADLRVAGEDFCWKGGH
jgi:hypothetical protein